MLFCWIWYPITLAGVVVEDRAEDEDDNEHGDDDDEEEGEDEDEDEELVEG